MMLENNEQISRPGLPVAAGHRVDPEKAARLLAAYWNDNDSEFVNLDTIAWWLERASVEQSERD